MLHTYVHASTFSFISLGWSYIEMKSAQQSSTELSNISDWGAVSCLFHPLFVIVFFFCHHSHFQSPTPVLQFIFLGSVPSHGCCCLVCTGGNWLLHVLLGVLYQDTRSTPFISPPCCSCGRAINNSHVFPHFHVPQCWAGNSERVKAFKGVWHR